MPVILSTSLRQRLARARQRLSLCGPDPAPSIARIAREAGCSTSHFIRVYQAVFGETPNRYRQRQRLLAARRLLSEPEVSVTDACLAVGFSSLGSFSTLFSRNTRIAPRHWSASLRSRLRVGESPAAALEPGCMSLMAAAFAAQGQASATATSSAD